MNKKRICMTSKYNSYNGITKKAMHLLIPLFIIHDEDESFVILKSHNGSEEFLYQNILNIKTWEEEKVSFKLENYKIENFVNEHTIKVKGKYILKFDISSERGFEIFDTWNYDFKDLKPSENKHKEICFYEKYRVFEFLLRIKPYITNLAIDKDILDKFNELIKMASA